MDLTTSVYQTPAHADNRDTEDISEKTGRKMHMRILNCNFRKLNPSFWGLRRGAEGRREILKAPWLRREPGEKQQAGRQHDRCSYHDERSGVLKERNTKKHQKG